MRFTPLSFLSEAKEELKKVTWPTKPKTIRLTLVVIGVSVLVGLYVGALDLAFTKIMAIVVEK